MNNRIENLRWGNQSQNCRNKKKRTKETKRETINRKININNKLIIEHDIEMDSRMKQIENQFIKINLEMTENTYKVLSKHFK